jgi:chromosome segregation ATPase
LEDLNGDTVSKALTSIKNLQTIRSTDVLQLKNSQWWVEWLSTVLQQWNTALSQSQNIVVSLQGSMSEAQAKVDGCTAQKAEADEMYRQWLAGNNSLLIDQATTQAQQASICISTSGVTVKSLNGVLLNLQSEVTKTQKYITFVNTNQRLITQYNDLLGGEVPSQLVQLQNEYESL